MKKLFLYLSLAAVFVLAAPLGASAQKEQPLTKKQLKAEVKKWKTKAKRYKKNPLTLKAREEAFQKEVEELMKRNKELADKNAQLQAELEKCGQKCKDQLRTLQNRIDSLMTEYKRLQTAYESVKNVQVKTETGSGAKPSTAITGLYFSVQVGAYAKFNMNKYLSQTDENFTGESAENLNKYMMGRFRDYNLAEAFRDDIKKLGIRDAWVVAYNDGVRIDVKEALKLQGKSR